ncbi:MAG: hypothetical protein IH955_04660 [Chloroflexi bacterium]|nr:hypothetical protein [Chloroflexota bacterium]
MRPLRPASLRPEGLVNSGGNPGLHPQFYPLAPARNPGVSLVVDAGLY